MAIIIADTNEFHPLVNGKIYRDSGHPYVILRATYSNSHLDLAYAVSLHQARLASIPVGHYGYMAAGVDAHAQGVFFGNVVKAHGGLNQFDTVWCDDEEGTGNQAGRVLAFLNAAHAVLHDHIEDEGVYSGASFWGAHNLGTLPNTYLRWIAAYGQSNPNVAGEDLWQFTDNQIIPGVAGPCDASSFSGSVSEFMKLVGAEGPFRHVVKPGNRRSIDQLAHARGWNVAGLVKFSLAHTNADHQAIINDYMLLRAALHVVHAPPPALPAGFVYWTVHP